MHAILALTGATRRNTLLVAGKLDEHAKLFTGKGLERVPEEDDVRVCLAEPEVVRRVLAEEGKVDVRKAANAELEVLCV